EPEPCGAEPVPGPWAMVVWAPPWGSFGLPGQPNTGFGSWTERSLSSSLALATVLPWLSLKLNLTMRTLNHSPQLVVWKYGATPGGSEHSVVARFDLSLFSVPATEPRAWRSKSMFDF